MSFFLSKFLPIFIYPLGLAIILALVAALLAWRSRRGGVAVLVLLSILVLWVPATPLFSGYIGSTLENRYPPVPVASIEKADVIVVLGGGIAHIGKREDMLDFDASFDRIYHAVQLYRAGKAPLIIVTGGGPEGRTTEADVMALLLMEFAVPEEVIIKESSSRNTRENGANVAELLKERNLPRIILVTSASHMGRAQSVFRQSGLHVVPAATDYRVDLRPSAMPIFDWLPSAQALHESTHAIKEYIGMQVYRWAGMDDT